MTQNKNEGESHRSADSQLPDIDAVRRAVEGIAIVRRAEHPTEDLSGLATGAGVIWRKEMRGGYGFITRVPSRVIRLGHKRVLIACRDKQDNERQRWVSPGRLDAAWDSEIVKWPSDIPVSHFAVVQLRGSSRPDLAVLAVATPTRTNDD